MSGLAKAYALFLGWSVLMVLTASVAIGVIIAVGRAVRVMHGCAA